MHIRERITCIALGICVATAHGGTLSINVVDDVRGGPLMGNSEQNVSVCMTGGLGIPIPGVEFYFWFFGGGYQGTVDGMPSGNYTPPTGGNGCVIVEVLTWRMQPTPPGAPYQYLQFSTLFQGDRVEENIYFVYNDPVLNLSTYAVGDVPAQVIVSIYPPEPYIRIVADCHATGGAAAYYSPYMRETNAAGDAYFTVDGSDLEIAVPSAPQPTASCTFATQTGGIHTATVEIRAVNVCTLGLSPADPRCG